MSIIIAALALAGAQADAQATQPANPHAGHAMKQGQAEHADHKMACCKDGKCECCEGKEDSKHEHSAHSGSH